MSNDDKIIESLIADGAIGSELKALIAKSSDDDDTLGAVVRASILATYEASQKAIQSGIPHFVMEDRKLYLIDNKGQKSFVKEIERPKRKLKKNFKLS